MEALRPLVERTSRDFLFLRNPSTWLQQVPPVGLGWIAVDLFFSEMMKLSFLLMTHGWHMQIGRIPKRRVVASNQPETVF